MTTPSPKTLPDTVKLVIEVHRPPAGCENIGFAIKITPSLLAEGAAEYAALAAQPIGVIPEGADTLRKKLQRQCSDWGTYWRAPDSHGVEFSLAQAIELLENALGVEVEVKFPGVHTAILEALQHYRCQHHQQDEDNGGLPLADVLTIPGATDISTGNEEIQLIADEVFTAIEMAAPQPPAGQQDISTSMVRCRWEEIKPGLGRFVPIDEFDIAPSPPAPDPHRTTTAVNQPGGPS